MLYIINHIFKDAKDRSDSKNRKQVNNVIKTLFHGFSLEETSFTQDKFWTEYTDFDNKNGSFYGDESIWRGKESEMVTVIFGIKNIHFLAPRLMVLFHV